MNQYVGNLDARQEAFNQSYQVLRNRINDFYNEINFEDLSIQDLVLEIEELFYFLIEILSEFGLQYRYDTAILRYKDTQLFVLHGNNFEGREVVVIEGKKNEIELRANTRDKIKSRVGKIIHDVILIIQQQMGLIERPEKLFILSSLFETMQCTQEKTATTL